MYKDEIIDAHFHLWDLDHGDYPGLKGKRVTESIIGDFKKIQKNFLIPDYEALVKPFNVTKVFTLKPMLLLKSSL